ncbi:MAG: DUF4333 domain-containing protein [Mycobacterium sp.]
MRFTTSLLPVLCALAVGCSTEPSPSAATPTVARDALQTDIAKRLSAAGDQPRSVLCNGDLIGEVGSRARCDVVVDDTNSFQPIVTVTRIVGDAIEYDLTPALSQRQLEAAVARLDAETSSVQPDSVTCDSGLVGEVGTVAYCDVVSAGVSVRRAVEVTDVSGLIMNFTLKTN